MIFPFRSARTREIWCGVMSRPTATRKSGTMEIALAFLPTWESKVPFSVISPSSFKEFRFCVVVGRLSPSFAAISCLETRFLAAINRKTRFLLFYGLSVFLHHSIFPQHFYNFLSIFSTYHITDFHIAQFFCYTREYKSSPCRDNFSRAHSGFTLIERYFTK